MITPQRPQGTTKFHSWAQQVHDRAFGSTRANESSGANVSRTTKGFFSPIKRVTQQPSGWRWSSTRVYDKDTTYAKDEIVVIRPTDSIVTTGATDADFADLIKAMPGTWVALRAVAPVNVGTEETPVYEYRIPSWPLFAPDNPDDEDNYWWPVSLYPSTVVTCIDGVESNTIINAQPETEYP